MCGIAERALLARAEALFGLADLGALPVPHAERDLLDRRAEHRERVEHVGVAIARDDLRGDGLGLESELARAPRVSIAGSRLPYTPTAPAILPTAIAWRARTSRLDARTTSAFHRANVRPAVIGSAWMPCERPIIGVFACSRALSASAFASPITPDDDPVERAPGLERERGIEHVRRRHPEVQPTRGLAGELLDMREKRDHVVPRLLLDLEDPLGGSSLPCAASRTFAAVPTGTVPGVLHRLAHGELDREPQLEAIGVVPQCRQLGPAVARDHLAP